MPINALAAIGGTYFFAVVLKMGAVGAFIGLSLDECPRALFLFLRWRSGRWEKKALVKKEVAENELLFLVGGPLTRVDAQV